jgi:vacuolar protein sorting-associated protein 26
VINSFTHSERMISKGSLFGALTGAKTVKIEIQLTPPPANGTNNTTTTTEGGIEQAPARALPMTHVPSWRLHKNAFWRVKHPLAVQQQQQQWQENVLLNRSSTSAASPSGGMRQRELMYCYEASQDVEGVVILRAQLSSSSNGSVKGVEHLGITVQFIGRIDMGLGTHDGRPQYDFVSLSKELAPPGFLYQPETVLPFKFKNMDKELESYQGRNVAVRYMIKVKLERKFLPAVVQEHDLWVQVLGQEPGHHEPLSLEVGIEDCLHINFEYERRHYHLDDTIRGTIRFLLVSIKLKHMELAVIRRETSGEGVALAAALSEGGGGSGGGSAAAIQATVDASNIYTETQTLVKYEIMDGAPVKGEVIPVKLCLRGIPADLTPTYTAVNNRFSVRYFLNLVLVDEDDRRYFKQQEIILWRKVFG